MPAALISGGTYYSNPELPSFFQGSSFIHYANTYNVTLALANFDPLVSGYESHNFDLGEENFNLILNTSLTEIQIDNVVWALFLPLGYFDMAFTNIRGEGRGITLSPTELDADYLLSSNLAVIQYALKVNEKPEITMDVFLGWNSSAYNVPSEALADETMIFLGASGVNVTPSKDTGLDVLFGLLTFNVPNVPYPLDIMLSGMFFIPLIIVGHKILTDYLPG